MGDQLEIVEIDENPFAGGSLACSISILLVALIGVVLNLVIIYIFGARRPLSSIHILLCGLAVADILLLITAAPLYASVSMYSYAVTLDPPLASARFVLGLEWAMAYMAVYLYPVTSVMQTLSVWILVLITIDRYIAVVHPFVARTICTRQRALVELVVLAVLSAGYNAIRVYDYELIEEIDRDPETGETYTRLIVGHALRANHAYLSIYAHWMYFCFIYALPCSTLLFLNCLVVSVIREAQKCRRILSRQRRTEYATATMMILVVALFLVCNSLGFIVNALESFEWSFDSTAQSQGGSNQSSSSTGGGDGQLSKSPPHSPLFYFLIDVSNLLILSHCGLNFLVYLAFSKRFRQQCRNLFTRESPRRKRRRRATSVNSSAIVGVSNSIRTKKNVLLRQFMKMSPGVQQCTSV